VDSLAGGPEMVRRSWSFGLLWVGLLASSLSAQTSSPQTNRSRDERKVPGSSPSGPIETSKATRGDAREAPDYSPEQLEARTAYSQAVQQYQKKQYQKASELCDEAHQLDRRYDKPLILWSACACELGDESKAEQILLRVLALRPNDTDLMLHLAYLERRLKRPDAALDVLRIAEKKVGRTSAVLTSLAETLMAKESWEDAEVALVELKKLDPKDLEARRLLVEVLCKRELADRALIELREIACLDKGNSSHGLRIARLLLQEGEGEAAARETEALCRRFPADKEVRRLLVQIYSSQVPDTQRLGLHETRLKDLEGSGR